MGTVPAAAASTERKEVVVARKMGAGRQSRMVFRFDEVLSSFSTQDDVFKATLAPLISQVLSGYEATAFAYGQTGTGKTYTMEGQTMPEDERGLMPRAASVLLDTLEKGNYSYHQITVSYLEIYNEELTDLLAPAQNQPKLDLMELGGNRGVCCVGLSEIPVSALDDITALVGSAQERRRVAETRLNARSSRSHCIFTLKVHCRRSCPGGEQEWIGKLHLVDLAGSECAKKAVFGFGFGEDTPPNASMTLTPRSHQVSSAQEQDRERKNINQSLLTLRRVIAALREKSGRVPYRDSKLTRLLQSALGGSSKTVVIATISPALAVVEETISTLTYAEQASGIMNRPTACTAMKSQSGFGASDIYSFGELSVGGTGDWSSEMELKLAYLAQEVEEAQMQLGRKQLEVQTLSDQLASANTCIQEKDEILEQLVSLLKVERAEREELLNGIGTLTDDLGVTLDPLAALRQDASSLLQHLKGAITKEAQNTTAEILKQQDKEMAAQLAETRAALARATSELASTRAELHEVRTQQGLRRQSALDAILETARREMGALGEHLDGHVEASSTKMGHMEACTEVVASRAAGMQELVNSSRQHLESTCCAYFNEVGTTADSLFQHLDKGTGSAEENVEELKKRLVALEAKSREAMSKRPSGNFAEFVVAATGKASREQDDEAASGSSHSSSPSSPRLAEAPSSSTTSATIATVPIAAVVLPAPPTHRPQAAASRTNSNTLAPSGIPRLPPRPGSGGGGGGGGKMANNNNNNNNNITPSSKTMATTTPTRVASAAGPTTPTLSFTVEVKEEEAERERERERVEEPHQQALHPQEQCSRSNISVLQESRFCRVEAESEENACKENVPESPIPSKLEGGSDNNNNNHEPHKFEAQQVGRALREVNC